jgi:hypothetical protein
LFVPYFVTTVRPSGCFKAVHLFVYLCLCLFVRERVFAQHKKRFFAHFIFTRKGVRLEKKSKSGLFWCLSVGFRNNKLLMRSSPICDGRLPRVPTFNCPRATAHVQLAGRIGRYQVATHMLEQMGRDWLTGLLSIDTSRIPG